jgi:hypothetical protein
MPRGNAGAAGNQRRLNTSQRTTSLTTTVDKVRSKLQVRRPRKGIGYIRTLAKPGPELPNTDTAPAYSNEFP